MTRKLAAFALCLAATATFADQGSKEIKIRKIATEEGVVTRLDEAVAQTLALGQQTRDQAMAQVNANLDVPAAFRPRFDQANAAFMKALQPQWTSFEIVEIFVKAYAPLVSEQDVDAALAYVSSDAGRRNAAAAREAAAQIASVTAARSGNRLQQAVESYMAEMRNAVRDCNCARAAPAKGK